MRPYIVVAAADAQIARVMLGMLFAVFKSLEYPMPGPTLYVWDPKPSADFSQVAFGPIDELDGFPSDGAWCLGQSIDTGMGELTLPAEPQQLDTEWFWHPPPIEE